MRKLRDYHLDSILEYTFPVTLGRWVRWILGAFAGAVFSTWVEKVGVVLTILPFLEKIPVVRKWLQDRPLLERFVSLIWIVGVGCVLYGFYGAWSDEHEKVLSQVTYMEIDPTHAPRVSPPLFKAGGVPVINVGITNVGSYMAIDECNDFRIELYDLPVPYNPESLAGPPTTQEIETSMFDKFKQDSLSTKRPLAAWSPKQFSWTSAHFSRELTSEEADQLRRGIKLAYVVGFSEWTDGAGRHERRYCSYVHPPADNLLTLEGCYSHNDFLQRAED